MVFVYCRTDSTAALGTLGKPSDALDSEVVTDRHHRSISQLGAELWNGTFVTKLFKGYTPREMDEDIVTTPATCQNTVF